MNGSLSTVSVLHVQSDEAGRTDVVYIHTCTVNDNDYVVYTL